MTTDFSVITPCFNANRWIRGCVASVADQEGVAALHIVQDGLSTDGTAEYVLSEPRIQAESEKDRGMYDAINKAWAKCTSEYVLHLNADEQLLPGALATVTEYFQTHPDVDVVLAGALICNRDGTINCYRRPLKPPLSFLLVCHHPIQSCAIFLRRSSFTDRPWLYDPSYRNVSDALFMIDILQGGKKIGLLDSFTSVFFLTGENMSMAPSPIILKERQSRRAMVPGWMHALSPFILMHFRVQKALAGYYRRRKLEYDLYIPEHEHTRTHFVAERAGGVYQS